MPVSSEISINGPYYPNGVALDFAFDFKATAANEVVAVNEVGSVISTALYSVSLDADEGGVLTFGTAPAAIDYPVIYVVSSPALTQPSDFDNSGPSFNPAAVTRAFDRAAARDLKQQREIDRGLKVPFGEVGLQIPGLASRIGKFLAFDGAGALIAVAGAMAVPALAANIATDGGGNVQAMLNSSLQANKHFNSVVTVVPGELAGWVLTTTPTPGQARDGLLIYHTMDDPSNGLHVLGYANSGCTGGQAAGFAMDGPGTGTAMQANRRGNGNGNGATGNVVDSVNGYGVSGQFSSLGTGAGVQAIKQNSGVTGTAGTGPALLIENSSNEGHAIDSATALVNTTDTSHRFTRLQRQGINADFRMNNAGARGGPISVVRAVLAPGGASTGAGVVAAFEAIIGANITGSAEVNGMAIANGSAGNTVAHGLYAASTGANITNYGLRCTASGATNNIALRADGACWLLGRIQISLADIPSYANDAAAAATLQVGFLYRNSTTGAITARQI